MSAAQPTHEEASPEPWKVALHALTRAAVILGQSRPEVDPSELERHLYPLEVAICILREDGKC